MILTLRWATESLLYSISISNRYQFFKNTESVENNNKVLDLPMITNPVATLNYP